MDTQQTLSQQLAALTEDLSLHGYTEQARAMSELLLEECPGTASAYLTAARLLVQQGDFAQAIIRLQDLLKFDIGDIESYFLLAELLQIQGRKLELSALAQQFEQVFPGHGKLPMFRSLFVAARVP